MDTVQERKTQYWDDRVPMMQWWADYLDALAKKV